MKRLTMIFLSVLMIAVLTGCGAAMFDPDNIADTSLRDGEMKLSGKVTEVSGETILIEDEKGGRYTFGYSDEITVVEDGYYVVDLSADSFRGKRVTVIANQSVMETWPMMLSDVRMIITE